jgi:3-oxoacyl-[acyl-carrier protein] reductase
MDLGLQGKVALVTGAGSQIGFGKGISLVLAREGCDVAVADVDYEGVRKTASEVEALGRKALAIKTDVTDSAQVKAMVKAVLDKFGKLDILVNNAGAGHPMQPFVDVPEAVWNKVIDLNVRGVMYCTQAVLGHMISQKSGVIISISSGAGISGMPTCVAYGAAKAAVIAFSKGLAKEVISSGVRVNNIAPGFGVTNFLKTINMPEEGVERVLNTVPTHKPTTPEDLGNMIAYLASDSGSQIIGQTLLIDGGNLSH